MNSEMVERFFAYARARQDIKLKRDQGLPAPWTDDPILREFRFCNVYREDDRVTSWFRESIRDPLRDDSSVLFATVLFRWFNRVETAERLLNADGISRLGCFTEFKPDVIRSALAGVSPITTAAYIIKTPNGMKKLEGLLWCLDQFWNGGKTSHTALAVMARNCHDEQLTLQAAHEWLMEFPFLGGFMAYEIVTDLRHTALLNQAPDIRTWANAGPGAIRGLNRIHARDLDKGLPQRQACAEMRELLELAPSFGWLDWEMREVEHTLCELDKYERARLNQGRPKQRFSPRAA